MRYIVKKTAVCRLDANSPEEAVKMAMKAEDTRCGDALWGEESYSWEEAPATEPKASKTGLKVKATVRLQAWLGDETVNLAHREFAAARILDGMSDDDIRKIQLGTPGYNDAVFYKAEALDLVDSWNGPFEVDFDEAELEAYMKARGIEL